LQRLTDAGNTVIVIEHNLDVIKNADYIIDLGPGAGDRGGYVIATGTPEEVAQQADSATGQYLTRILNRDASPSILSPIPFSSISSPSMGEIKGEGVIVEWDWGFPVYSV